MNIHSYSFKVIEVGVRIQNKEQLADQRKQQILDSALTVFSRKGFGKATIPDISQEAGVAVGTIYNYFDSKRDLLVSLIANFIIAEPLFNILEQPSNTDLDEVTIFNSIIENRLSFGFERFDRISFVLGEVQRDADLRKKFAQDIVKPLMELSEKHLEARISSGSIRSLNTDIVARAIAGMMIGFTLINRIEGEKSPCNTLSRQELRDQLFQT